MGTDHKKVFSIAEVSSHNNPKDCWVIVNAKMVCGVRTVGCIYKGSEFISTNFRSERPITEVKCEPLIDEINGPAHQHPRSPPFTQLAYNVTNFLTDHPGGEEVLLACAGKDASEEFEDAGHGSSARLMLDEFYVGEIDQSSTMPTKKAHIATPKQPRNNEEKSSDNITNLLRFLVPFGVFVVAIVGIHLYT